MTMDNDYLRVCHRCEAVFEPYRISSCLTQKLHVRPNEKPPNFIMHIKAVRGARDGVYLSGTSQTRLVVLIVLIYASPKRLYSADTPMGLDGHPVPFKCL